MPKISIIVPSYNHAAYLPKRLDSIYGQTFRDCEVILLDDCSSDGSQAILEHYPKTLPTRCIFNQANSGRPIAQWVKGLGLAEGELIWIAESDDACEPAFLETLVHELDADPGAALAFCQSRVIDSEGRTSGLYTEVINRKYTDRYRQSFRNDGIDECTRFMLRENLIPNGSAVLFRRRLATGIEPLLAQVRYMGDWLLYMHLLTQGALRFVAEPLNYYRIHPANQSYSPGALAVSFDVRLKGLKWISQRIAVPDHALREIVDELMAHWFFVYGSRAASFPRREAFRQFLNIHREGGVPWTTAIAALFRLALRRLKARMKRSPNAS